MALASRAFGAFLKLPPALTRDVEVQRDVAVPAPDGTTLLTDLYLARPAGPRPTILIRTPYGRRVIAGGGLAARGLWRHPAPEALDGTANVTPFAPTSGTAPAVAS